MKLKDRLTITEVAEALGITPRTIMRWEKAGKIKRSKRDWRGWRFYHREDLEDIKRFHESSYDYDEFNGSIVNAAKELAVIMLVSTGLLASVFCLSIYADAPDGAEQRGLVETEKTVDIVLDELPVRESTTTLVREDTKYTLGPDDVISIEVRRHPEFSGRYTINQEGKIEYRYIGDIVVSGLNKTQLKERLTQMLSEYLIEPEVDIQIDAYLSKVFYVVGDVNRPGKFYMRGNTVTVREALMQSGLPNQAAAMRKCRLITPSANGKSRYKCVNVYELLYGGDLRENLEMKPGEVLYVPATLMAKVIRVISPVTNAVAETAGAAASGAATVAIGL